MSELTARGSTSAWRRRRAMWSRQVQAGDVTCWRCGRLIQPDQPWDLGHLIDRQHGGNDNDTRPEHASCNRSAGARRKPRPRWIAQPW